MVHESELPRRLREERERLGLSQSAFGALGGVSKGSQIAYEQGRAQPGAAYLERLASGGVDVRYVLTGSRAPAPDDATQDAWLSVYRRLDAEQRDVILNVAEQMAQYVKDPKKRN